MQAPEGERQDAEEVDEVAPEGRGVPAEVEDGGVLERGGGVESAVEVEREKDEQRGKRGDAEEAQPGLLEAEVQEGLGAAHCLDAVERVADHVEPPDEHVVEIQRVRKRLVYRRNELRRIRPVQANQKGG